MGSGRLMSDQSEESEFGSENHFVYEVRRYGRFVGVLILSNRQIRSIRFKELSSA